MKKNTFLLLLSLIFSANVAYSMHHPNYTYNPLNYTHNMPLHMYISLGNYQAVENLLKSTPLDINQQDTNGNTPLHIATIKNNLQIVQLLLKYGAKNIPNHQSYSPTDIAANFPNRQIWSILTEPWINDISELL